MESLSDILFKLGMVFALALLNGFFVAAEFAIVKVRGTRIETLVKKGNQPAKAVQHIIHHLNAYLSACQLGITIASLGLGWIGEPFVARLIAPLFTVVGLTASVELAHILATPLAFMGITFLHIVLGELAPKQIAIQREETTALWIAYPLKWFYKIFYPAIWLLNESAIRMLHLIGFRAVSETELAHTEEELRLIFSESHRVGKLSATGKQIMDNVLTFTHRQVKEVMVPRTNIVGLDIKTPAAEITKTAVDTGYSRMPVYRDALDHIAGIVYIKDILALEENRELIILSDLLRPAFFVPETKLISELLRELQKKKIHMAIVVNEYGAVTGLVTLEDLIEEIVGEIQDEYDTEEERVLKLKDGSLSVDASMSLHDLREDYKIRLPENMPYDTLAGFMLDELAKIPLGGETVTYENQLFTVTKVEGHRLVRVKITPGKT
ncbi:MAG: hemolysin family protein, partial [bacterium]|nr:hemolysin family protein [bacterium]